MLKRQPRGQELEGNTWPSEVQQLCTNTVQCTGQQVQVNLSGTASKEAIKPSFQSTPTTDAGPTSSRLEQGEGVEEATEKVQGRLAESSSIPG